MPINDPFVTITADELADATGGAARITARDSGSTDQVSMMMQQMQSAIAAAANKKTQMDPTMMMMMVMMMGRH
jgi:hypothetical protein